MALTGFQVTLDTGGRAEFQLYNSPVSPSSETPLLTFAEDPATGSAAVVMGPLYYRETLTARLPSDVMRDDEASDADLVLAAFRHLG
ncbi:MAG TPA: hypothetical protein VFT74_06445, partial [Isosphaeraceae bacterium]|nr:hypothetical protein [Isosphaeraceae bacterium]